jgi:hypothetical protein
MIIDSGIATSSFFVSGTLTATNGITGSLFGTSSWASNAASSSYVLSASNATTASYIQNAASSSYALSASISQISVTASRALQSNTASYVQNAASASYALTSSFAISTANATSASYATFANTASSADNFNVRGTLTATTIIVQTITSSTDFVTGSTRFGSIITNTHQFTGSVNVSGSITVSGSVINNLTASNATTASYILNAASASYALSASNAQTASYILNAVTASYVQNAASASYALSASNAQTASFVATASWAINATNASTSSWATNVNTASWANNVTTASRALQANTASYVQLAASASYALSSSYALNASTSTSASFATTSSFSFNAANASSASAAVFASTSSLAQSLNPGTVVSASNIFVSNNLTVNGTASFNYLQVVSGSATVIGGQYIVLNTQAPTARFAGLQIVDSGSVGGSGSLLYDSVQDEFIFVHRGDGTNTTSSHFILGPETYNNVGNESYLALNRLPKGTGIEHLIDSNISDNNTKVSIFINTEVTGGLIVTNGVTGSLLGTSSYSLLALTASIADNAVTASRALQANTASYIQLAASASYALSASNAQTASFVLTASWATNAVNAISASWATNVNTASWANNVTTASRALQANTASYIQLAASSSYALSASYALNSSTATSASFASTASFVPNAFIQGGNSFGTTATLGTNDAQTLNIRTNGTTRLAIDSVGTASLNSNVFNLNGFLAGTINQTLPAGNTFVNQTINLGGSGSGWGVINRDSWTILDDASTPGGFALHDTRLFYQNNKTVGGGGIYTGYSIAGLNYGTGSMLWAAFRATTPAGALVTGSYNSFILYDSNTGPQSFVSASIGTLTGFNVGFGYGGAVTTANGLFIGATWTGSTTFAVRTQIPSASNQWNIYAEGAAPNYFAGRVGINSTSTALANLQINGNVSASSYTGSLFGTASWANNALTSSYVLNAVSSSFASTASSADNFLVRGTLTAQTIVAQVITSSTDFVTGSTRFGSSLTNTHQFTGSVSITGSLDVKRNLTFSELSANILFPTGDSYIFPTAVYSSGNGSINIGGSGTGAVKINLPAVGPNTSSQTFIYAGDANPKLTVNIAGVTITGSLVITGSTISTLGFTGSLSGSAISASYATSASVATSASYADTATTASRALNANTASYIQLAASASYALSASYTLNASTSISASFATSASYAMSASISQLAVTASYILNAASSSYALSSSNAQTASFVATASWSTNAINAMTASWATNVNTASWANNATNASTASWATNVNTASWANNVTTASRALQANTASYVQNAASASYALSASYAPGSGGSVSASYAATASTVNPLDQRVIITNILAVGTSSIGSTESALIVGTLSTSNTGEGGQILLQATGGLYTSASMLDTYQNQFRILRGTNVTSDAQHFGINLHNGQIIINKYSGSGAFTGVVAANLAVDANGNVLTVAPGTVTSASFATTSSYAFSASAADNATTASRALQANTASYVQLAASASYALSASNAQTASFVATASWATNAVNAMTASWATNVNTASWANNVTTASRALQANTASYIQLAASASYALSSSNAITASYILNAASASYALSASNAQTASYILNAITASYILSASYTPTSSYAYNALTSSYAVATSTVGYSIGGTQIYYASVLSSTSPVNQNIFTNNTGSFNSAFYNYNVYSGSNARSGQIIASWISGSIQYTDFSTVDIGNTLAVTGSVVIVTGQVQLNFQVPSSTAGWNIKATATYI